jgi:hypothetical protein
MARIVNTFQLLSNCTECGTARTLAAKDTVEVILTLIDSQKSVTGVCTRCKTPWQLGYSERQEIGHEMAVAWRATEAAGIAHD